ncbi:Transmembrane protein [Trichinella pseudospiralis]
MKRARFGLAKRLCKKVQHKVEIEEKAEAEVGKEKKKKKKINRQQPFRITAFASLSGDVGAFKTVAVHLVKCCRLERERTNRAVCCPAERLASDHH